jgi:hypothetical protein
MSENNPLDDKPGTVSSQIQARHGLPAEIAAAPGDAAPSPGAVRPDASGRKRRPPPMQFAHHFMGGGTSPGDLLADLAERLAEALKRHPKPPSKDKGSK